MQTVNNLQPKSKEQSKSSNKGQTISKANYGVLNSPKKQKEITTYSEYFLKIN